MKTQPSRRHSMRSGQPPLRQPHNMKDSIASQSPPHFDLHTKYSTSGLSREMTRTISEPLQTFHCYSLVTGPT
eukprot:5248194-Amphidinium_carterae.2